MALFLAAMIEPSRRETPERRVDLGIDFDPIARKPGACPVCPLARDANIVHARLARGRCHLPVDTPGHDEKGLAARLV